MCIYFILMNILDLGLTLFCRLTPFVLVDSFRSTMKFIFLIIMICFFLFWCVLLHYLVFILWLCHSALYVVDLLKVGKPTR